MSSFTKTLITTVLASVFAMTGSAFAICDESIVDGNTVTVNAGETLDVNCGERFYIGNQDSAGGHLVVNGGTVNITTADRFCIEYNSDITINEGEINVTANGEGWYFPDNSGEGTGPRIFVNGGVFTLDNAAYDANCSRDGHVYVSCGTFRTKTDLRDTCGGTIHAAAGFEPLVYSSEDGFHVFTGSKCTVKVEFETAASGALESITPAVLNVTVSEPQEREEAAKQVVRHTFLNYKPGTPGLQRKDLRVENVKKNAAKWWPETDGQITYREETKDERDS